jgi:hypothetical protein
MSGCAGLSQALHGLKKTQAFLAFLAGAAFLAALGAALGAGALAALRAAALGSTAALKVAPAVNLGSLAAAILILAPVLGVRAA